MTKRNPYDLLTYRRFDVVIKYLYAANQSSEFYKEMYRSHLKAMNNFRERDPYKRGFDAFDKAFKSVINNLVETPPIPVNDLGHITNGAHRLAAALYLNKFVDTVGSELTALADYQYFIKRGLKKFVMQRTAIEYAKLKSNSYVICLFPIAHSRMWEVKNIIMKYANIFYESTEELNPTGQLGLMKEIYLVEGWANEAGIQRKSDQCFRGENQVTFMLVDAPSLETVKEMKAKIREEFNIGNHSVHICDYHEDTIISDVKLSLPLNEKEILGKFADTKLDFYGIKLGFEGYKDALQHDFNIAQKDPYNNICNDHNGFQTFYDPFDAIQKILKKAEENPNIPNQVLNQINNSITNILEHHSLNRQRLNINQIESKVKNIITALIAETKKELYNALISLKTHLFLEENHQSELIEVLVGKGSENSKKRGKSTLSNQNLHKLYDFIDNNDISTLEDINEDSKTLKAFILTLLNKHGEASLLLGLDARRRFFDTGYPHDIFLYYEISLFLKDKNSIKRIEQGDWIYKKNNPIYDIHLFLNSLKDINNVSIKDEKKTLALILYIESSQSLLSKKEAMTYSILGGLKYFLNDYNCEETVTYYLKAIDLNSQNINDYLFSSFYFIELGAYKKAEEILSKSLAIHQIYNNDIRFIYGLQAYIHLKNKEYKKALYKINEVIS